MRKLLLFLVLAAMSIASQNVDAQDRVKEIRKMYADALQDLNAMKEEPHLVNIVEIRNTATEGGVGIVEETTTFYSYHTENMSVVTDGGNDFYSLFFVRTKRDYKEAPAQGISTSEYLFDTETGNLVFCFKKTPGYEDSIDMYQEERFYFNANGTLCTSSAVVKQKKDNSKVTEFVANEEEVLRESLRLMNLFNSIRNRGLVKQFEQSVTSSSDLGFFELNGPVKHVRYENGDELSFDKNGTLVLRNGVNPFRYTKTDGHGNWTERETSDGNTVKRTIEYMENMN